MARAKSQHAELYRQFGEMIVAEREAKGLSQSEVARRLGRPQSSVWKYENGELRLDVVEFLVFAKAIGFDPSDFVARLDGLTK